jgi:hypothetical protein
LPLDKTRSKEIPKYLYDLQEQALTTSRHESKNVQAAEHQYNHGTVASSFSAIIGVGLKDNVGVCSNDQPARLHHSQEYFSDDDDCIAF